MRFAHVVLQKRRERLRERSSTSPSQRSSAHTESRESSSARITSTIAIATSTATRRSSGASAGHGVDVPVEAVVAPQLRHRLRVGEQRVDELGGVVALGRQQLAQHGPQRAQRLQLGRVASRGGR